MRPRGADFGPIGTHMWKKGKNIKYKGKNKQKALQMTLLSAVKFYILTKRKSEVS